MNLTSGQAHSLALYFVLAIIVSVFLIKWFYKTATKERDDFYSGYNKMVRAFRSGNLEQVKQLKRESELEYPELYSAYKAGIKKAYADCLDPNINIKDL